MGCSTETLTLLELFKSVYNQLNTGNAQGPLLDSLYTRDVVFEDPFHRIEGLSKMKDYCESVYENVTYCQFEFHRHWASHDDAMLTWTMEVSHPKLNKGDRYQVEGSTFIQFQSVDAGDEGTSLKVSYHRDYYDAGQSLYEHIPLMGAAIQKLKNRMV
jgi:hypothetical protein